jgi:hypothetical protein
VLRGWGHGREEQVGPAGGPRVVVRPGRRFNGATLAFHRGIRQEAAMETRPRYGSTVDDTSGARGKSIRVSLIINTACADPQVSARRNPFRAATYAERASLLENDILPRAKNFNEVIVSGAFPSTLPDRFPAARFVHAAAQRYDRWDALHQREVGARFASGDILVFCHDDHASGEALADYLRRLDGGVDIVVPKRIHLKTGATLNNGRVDNYMGGHCYAMRRWIWASCPLTSAPDEFWDTYLTPIWKKAGANIIWTDDASHYDCEAATNED